MGGKTKLSGIHINHNIPIEATIAYHVEGNYFIVAALDNNGDQMLLKMVKIRVTGETTFKWISARYIVSSSNPLCKRQRTFNLDCFSGASMSSKSYNVVLRAGKGIQISIHRLSSCHYNYIDQIWPMI